MPCKKYFFLVPKFFIHSQIFQGAFLEFHNSSKLFLSRNVSSDVNILKLIEFHKNNKTISTITAVQPPGRFGMLDITGNKITSFKEKPPGDGNWINGGFFVLEPKVFDYIEGDSTVWERKPLEKLAAENQLAAYKHSGFWQPLDTLRDKNSLEELWNSKKAPWNIWE